MRAWETGRWLLQVTPTGYTAVVGPSGQVVERSSLGARDVVEYTVAKRTGWTVYVATGDDSVALLALIALVAAWLTGRSRPGRDNWTLAGKAPRGGARAAPSLTAARVAATVSCSWPVTDR